MKQEHGVGQSGEQGRLVYVFAGDQPHLRLASELAGTGYAIESLSATDAAALDAALRSGVDAVLIEAGAARGVSVAGYSVPVLLLEQDDAAALRAAAAGADVVLDCESPARIHSAVDALLGARPGRVADRGRDAASLSEIGAEVMKLAEELIRLSSGHAPPPTRTARDQATMIREMLRARRAREAHFGAGLFADPVWDILLDLTASQLEGTRVSVTSLCIAASVPTTTALRSINALVERGMLVRTPDPADRRREYVSLSPDTFDAMLRYLAQHGAARA